MIQGALGPELLQGWDQDQDRDARDLLTSIVAYHTSLEPLGPLAQRAMDALECHLSISQAAKVEALESGLIATALTALQDLLKRVGDRFAATRRGTDRNFDIEMERVKVAFRIISGATAHATRVDIQDRDQDRDDCEETAADRVQGYLISDGIVTLLKDWWPVFTVQRSLLLEALYACHNLVQGSRFSKLALLPSSIKGGRQLLPLVAEMLTHMKSGAASRKWNSLDKVTS